MRLIDTTTKTLAEFESSDAPPYAILSHTWTKEEITYQDLQTERKAGKEAGYAKLDNGCQLAAAAGFKYIWLDTCCNRNVAQMWVPCESGDLDHQK
jgi:hypothetical protein